MTHPTHPALHHGAATTVSSLGAPVHINWVHEFGAMLLVIGILWLIARFVKKRAGLGTLSRQTSGQIKVLARQSLSKGVALAVVHVGGKDILVGITPSGVSMISELDLGLESEAAETELDVDPGASVEPGTVRAIRPMLSSAKAPWTGAGASPLQAWMAKLDGLREMTVRRS